MFKYLYVPPPGHERQIEYIHSHAHNDYLEVAADMGCLGLVTFLGIFISFFALTLKKIKIILPKYHGIYTGLQSVIFAMFVSSCGGSIITVGMQAAALFWFFLGICSNMAANQYYLQQLPQSKI